MCVIRTYLLDGKLSKRFVSQRPYLVRDHPITPHITLNGVFVIEDGLRGCPLDWDVSSLGLVIVIADIA